MMTVVFTGLIIFESNAVHLLKTERPHQHQMLVSIQNTKGAWTKEVRDYIRFDNLTPGNVGKAEGLLPSLTAVFTGTPRVDGGQVKTLNLSGGKVEPYRSYAVCTVKEKPTLFWEAFRWSVAVTEKAKLVIDTEEFDLDNQTKIVISNDYVGETADPHVLMYKKALKDTGAEMNLPVCDPQAYVRYPLDPGDGPISRKASPITCPPMALK